MKYLIAGLGNIGKEYSTTRHNAGFLILDNFIDFHKTSFKDKRFGFISELNVFNHEIFCLKPTTYMNNSGIAINYWLRKKAIAPENLFVITDDVSLPFGIIKIKPMGGTAGHNGLKSINDVLGHNKYPRLRFGIGNNYNHGGQTDYVLGKWTHNEQKELDKMILLSINLINVFLENGIEYAMNQGNTKTCNDNDS